MLSVICQFFSGFNCANLKISELREQTWRSPLRLGGESFILSDDFLSRDRSIERKNTDRSVESSRSILSFSPPKKYLFNSRLE
ncbi:MAG: hypothetical protein D6680_17995 [Cyanobacteria bacterium J007]|nr:MAG: hypothetical protein D6680_17995 [Cyanobacteria bacterium J007]